MERLGGSPTNAAYFAAIQQGDFSNQWVTDLVDASGCPVTP